MRTDSPFPEHAGFPGRSTDDQPKAATPTTTSDTQTTRRTFDSKYFRLFVKAQPARTIFRVRIRTELPIEGEKGRCFPGLSSVQVSRKAWLMCGLDMVSGVLEQRGARIPVCTVITERPAEKYSYRCVYID